ncbi:MAG: glycosyltransferase family 39 protein, partial [Anaerolineae bacterium]|nr:glycosyltransferase family 39 protein [Anaerolineae bacterium]
MKIRPKAVLGVILGLFVLLGILNSVTIPLFEAPDELWHFAFVRYLALNGSLPVQPKQGTDIWLRESGQPPLYYLVAAPIAAAFDTSDFPDFARFNVAHPAVTANSQSDAPNVFIHTPYEAFPYRGSVLVIHLLRLFTLLWGVGAIVGVYLAAQEIWPGHRWLSLAAVCLTAFNPHFIYISSVVNNDATVTCLATLTLWLCLRLLKRPQSRRCQTGLGIVLGLALLSKLSAVALLGIAGLALGMIWWRDRDTKAFFVRCLIVFGLALLVARWWYARNWRLYGDPLGWSVWLAHAGVEDLGILDLLRQIPQVAERFWSPYDALFPAWSLWLLAAVTLVVVVGWIKLLGARKPVVGFLGEGVILSAVWLAVLCISLLRFMSLTPAANGRLLFPGIAAFSTLWVLGFRAALPEKWATWGFGIAIAGLLLLSLYSPLLGIAPRYALPLVKSSAALEGVTVFDDAKFGAVWLLGVR